MPDEVQNPAETVTPPETSVPSVETPIPVEEAPVTPAEPQAPQAIPEPEPSVQVPAPTPVITPSPKSFLAKALEAIQFRKRKKLEKIIKFVSEKGSITNDQVEKLLRVSDATATRYLSELVRRGSLKRVGTASGSRYAP